MVDPKVYPRNKHASWKRFLWCFMGTLAHKEHTYNELGPRQLLAYITRPRSVEASVVGTFYRLSNLAWQYPIHKHVQRKKKKIKKEGKQTEGNEQERKVVSKERTSSL